MVSVFHSPCFAFWTRDMDAEWFNALQLWQQTEGKFKDFDAGQSGTMEMNEFRTLRLGRLELCTTENMRCDFVINNSYNFVTIHVNYKIVQQVHMSLWAQRVEDNVTELRRQQRGWTCIEAKAVHLSDQNGHRMKLPGYPRTCFGRKWSHFWQADQNVIDIQSLYHTHTHKPINRYASIRRILRNAHIHTEYSSYFFVIESESCDVPWLWLDLRESRPAVWESEASEGSRPRGSSLWPLMAFVWVCHVMFLKMVSKDTQNPGTMSLILKKHVVIVCPVKLFSLPLYAYK